MPLEYLTKYSLVGHLCLLISPLFSVPFIHHHIKPNTITIIMIFCGVMGGILFSLPYLFCKILALIVYWLWFVFDCSDGEVARFTQTFSKYGKLLDWMAHLTCHPLFILSTWFSFKQIGTNYMDMITIVSILLVAFELIRRNLIAFDSLLSVNTEMGIAKPQRLPLHRWCLTQIMYFPNMVLILPIIFVISIITDWNGIAYIYFIWASLNCLYVTRDIIRYTIFMHKS